MWTGTRRIGSKTGEIGSEKCKFEENISDRKHFFSDRNKMKKIGEFPFGQKIFIFGPKQVQWRRKLFFRTENISFRSETTPEVLKNFLSDRNIFLSVRNLKKLEEQKTFRSEIFSFRSERFAVNFRFWWLFLGKLRIFLFRSVLGVRLCTWV